MSVELKIPNVGESIQEVLIGQWLKQEGDAVEKDETIVELETDKASMELSAPASGVLAKVLKQAGEKVAIGETIAHIDETVVKTQAKPARPKAQAAQAPKRKSDDTASDDTASDDTASDDTAADDKADDKKADEKRAAPAQSPAKATSQDRGDNSSRNSPVPVTPSGRRALRQYGVTAEEIQPTGKRVRREDVMRYVESHQQDSEEKTLPAQKQAEPTPVASVKPKQLEETRGELEEVVPMSLIRRRIAARLVEAQQQAALLTTFNEADMTAVMELRKRFKEPFEARYGIKLGFMSFFVKASIDALKQFPEINAEIRDTNIIYRHYYHIGIAIGSQRGLVVPVLRHAERLSFAEIEAAINDFAQRAGNNKLKPHELEGGTFTISNGGIYGSLLSTPIVNPPQSGVLGMHAIQERPIARDGQVVIRPMMYLALTYDHRIVDGREAVSFLKRLKEGIEEPSRILIEA